MLLQVGNTGKLLVALMTGIVLVFGMHWPVAVKVLAFSEGFMANGADKRFGWICLFAGSSLCEADCRLCNRRHGVHVMRFIRFALVAMLKHDAEGGKRHRTLVAGSWRLSLSRQHRRVGADTWTIDQASLHYCDLNKEMW